MGQVSRRQSVGFNVSNPPFIILNNADIHIIQELQRLLIEYTIR